MTPLNSLQKLTIFLVSSLIYYFPVFILMNILYFISRVTKKLSWLNTIIPAFLVALLTLLLIDNFTYTIFKFGIVTSTGIWRAAYALLLICFFIYFIKTLYSQIQTGSKKTSSQSVTLTLLLITASIVATAFQIPNLEFLKVISSKSTTTTISEKPNIILLGMDGVNATNMSAYGYKRDTTPNITQLAKNALFVENAFSNAANTGGSLTSILTGKDPTQTRVYYPPDILMGEDAYQHLPGILKQLGYNTVQITDSSFGDAYSRNIKNGFDVANFRSENTNPLLDQLSRLNNGESFYFVTLIAQRAIERIEHIFYINQMVNPYLAVTKPVSKFNTEKRYFKMIDALEITKEPVFMHFHMLITHGSKFSLRENKFSLGETQNNPWMVDFYDDAIAESDGYVKKLFVYLKKSGKIDNTIVILYSDHGMAWNARNRVPLIIWFPKNKYSGVIKENVQLLDIAPTILDYLQQPQPDWMSGQSLLSDKLTSTQPIFIAATSAGFLNNGENGIELDQTKIAPPFYQLGSASMIVCNQWFYLNLGNPGLSRGSVAGSTAPCNQDAIPSPEKAREILLQHLEKMVMIYPPIQKLFLSLSIHSKRGWGKIKEINT